MHGNSKSERYLNNSLLSIGTLVTRPGVGSAAAMIRGQRGGGGCYYRLVQVSGYRTPCPHSLIIYNLSLHAKT